MASKHALLCDIYDNYAQSVGLNPAAHYLHGTPLRPVVPLDIGEGGVFVLGAYPSARFAQIGAVSNVPIADNLGPFEQERWFDGTRVREQPSARELHTLFLEPLALDRSKCWISDLVKVFLFKEGHVARYTELGSEYPAGYHRKHFAELAGRSVQWLIREVDAAKPILLITLGIEVAGILRGVHRASDQVHLLTPRVQPLSVGCMTVPTIHCAHPGILMRPGPTNPWPGKHGDAFLPTIREFLLTRKTTPNDI